MTLTRLLIDLYERDGGESDLLFGWTVDTPLDSRQYAWEQGYDLADSLYETVRRQVRGLPDGWVDVESIVRFLDIRVTRGFLDDAGIRGCSVVGPVHRPAIMINDSYPWSNSEEVVRFTLAHELCHLLYDRHHSRRLAIASGPWAPRDTERRANAFAAMFLMPSPLLREALATEGDEITDLDGLGRIARRLRVSTRVALWHLYNLTFMPESTRDRLLQNIDADGR